MGDEIPASKACMPLPSQFTYAGGPYDPAAYGIGFFAAIVIAAKDVVLDLNGHTLEQSQQHALMQRFYANIELADQPFIPKEGPHNFGEKIQAAENVVIKNGTLGRSSHHGIHGNGAKNITIEEIAFKDFEVAAIALNGVQGLTVRHVTAHNREDIPVVGTFSSARFLQPYLDWLIRTGSQTTLKVKGRDLDVKTIAHNLTTAINHVHQDLIEKGLPQIDQHAHPEEYALFHNPHGVLDGNSYSFVLNHFGMATNGFPSYPEKPAKDILFEDVHILSQRAFVNEIVALRNKDTGMVDPVGAVFQIQNLHPDTQLPLTLSNPTGRYQGNVVANAQALVAKAALNGDFNSAPLDISRLNISQDVIDWIEQQTPLSTLLAKTGGYYCNGDSMFHVNKGVIGFKLDGAENVTLTNTSAQNLENYGANGSALCGPYSKSHPMATLIGYGGAKTRGYSIAGSKNITIKNSQVKNCQADNDLSIGFDILTDTSDVTLNNCSVEPDSPNNIRISPQAKRIIITKSEE
ncbi:MAG: right-handed parallel beta-helix repeat-containing protein [Chlamydiia bacterium]|nr:right-handed parallel beta-helix repeat-containing protein [Chlamydiia bacterium]